MIDRATGVTTRLILETVMHVLENPDTWVVCTDHYDTYAADVDLYIQVKNILSILNVPFETRGYSILVPKIQPKEYPLS